MKNNILMIILTLATSISFAGEQIKIGVKGMVCAFCAQGIEKKFRAESEVDKIDISLESKFVKLTFKDGRRITNDKIAQILKDAGYEAVFEPPAVVEEKDNNIEDSNVAKPESKK